MLITRRHRDNLWKHRPTLPHVVTDLAPVVVHLVERGVITSRQASHIRSRKSSDFQVTALCLILMDGPDRDYYELINALRDTGQEEAARLLDIELPPGDYKIHVLPVLYM